MTPYGKEALQRAINTIRETCNRDERWGNCEVNPEREV